MNINAISESIKELLAEQNHDVTNITMASIINRINALNNIVIQFVSEANKDVKLSTDLGITNDEVGRLHLFNEYIERLDDTDFNTNLDECKLVNRTKLLLTLNEIERIEEIVKSVVNRDQIEADDRNKNLKMLVEEITMQVRLL